MVARAGGDVGTGEIELVFRPHPLEMNEDNELIRELKDSSIRYIKTTANATGTLWGTFFLALSCAKLPTFLQTTSKIKKRKLVS